MPHPYFQKGVEKIQQNNVGAMTSQEHVACASLRVNTIDNTSTQTKATTYLSCEKHLERFKRQRLDIITCLLLTF